MRVISVSLRNFASYKQLDFSFEDQGLTLLQGPTGSGKSTLCDAVPWILFGTTAKGGAVTDVISWTATEPTSGVVVIEFKDGSIGRIFRVRGDAKDNDLYYSILGAPQVRGKDLNDTQKLINNLLGVDSALYLSGAYLHEFSQTAQFFITTAKNRRTLCEQLVDLSLATKLQTKLVADRKNLAKLGDKYASNIQLYADRLRFLTSSRELELKRDNFDADKAETIRKLSIKINAIKILPNKYFSDAERDIQLASYALGTDKCSECGAKKHSEEHDELLKLKYELKQESSRNAQNIESLQELKKRQKEVLNSKNEYQELIDTNNAVATSTKAQIAEVESLLATNSQEIADIDLLLEVINDFRSVSITNTVKRLEQHTNQLLTDHFDAEIRVKFDVADADKLDVLIYKDGNECSYSQLSKGQRCLLKLCFGVAVMRRIGDHHGINFNCLFFDEALDGLSDVFKLKAYNLFKTLGLSYENIFVVEHSEALKALFGPFKISVRLENGNSILEKY